MQNNLQENARFWKQQKENLFVRGEKRNVVLNFMWNMKNKWGSGGACVKKQKQRSTKKKKMKEAQLDLKMQYYVSRPWTSLLYFWT